MSREFAIRLYHLRTHRTSYSHAKIAEMLHLDRSTYTKYECGDTEPSIQTLIGIKKALNVSYDELLSEELEETEISDYELRQRRKSI